MQQTALAPSPCRERPDAPPPLELLLPNLQHNAQAVAAVHTPAPVVEVAELNWSRDAAELAAEHGSFDVLLASDVVYSSGCVSGLAAATSALLREGGELLMAYPQGRHGQVLFRQALSADRLLWRDVREEVLPAALLRGCAHQGTEREVTAHQFVLLRATRAFRGKES